MLNIGRIRVGTWKPAIVIFSPLLFDIVTNHSAPVTLLIDYYSCHGTVDGFAAFVTILNPFPVESTHQIPSRLGSS